MKRKLSPPTVLAFGLGFSPSDSSVISNLTASGYTIEDMLDAGLIVSKSKGTPDGAGAGPEHYVDRFRGRLTIPIRDRRGSVLAFGARVSAGVFGIDLAADAIRSEDSAIVVEGYFDVMALHNADVRNAVAIMGTAAKAAQIELIARLCQSGKVFLLLDSDEAGQQAMEGMCMNVLPFVRLRTANVRMLRMPEPFKDAAEFLSKNDKMSFVQQVISEGGTFWKDWYTDRILASYNETDTFTFTAAAEKFTDFLAKLRSPADRTFYLYRLADRIADGNRRFALQLERDLKKMLNDKLDSYPRTPVSVSASQSNN